MKDRTARGVALVNLISLNPDEQIQAVIDTRTYEDGAYLFFATKNGIVKKTKMSEYDSSIRSGLKAINLRGNDELVKVIQTTGNDDIVMVSRMGMTIRFAESAVRAMGRDAGGVRGMKLRSEDDAVVAADVARPGAVMLFVSTSGHGKRTKLDLFKTQGRGGQGVRGIKITASRGAVVARVRRHDRRRDLGVLLGGQYHPDGSQGDLIPGPRRHRSACRPPRRRRDRRRRGPRAGSRRRRGRLNP